MVVHPLLDGPESRGRGVAVCLHRSSQCGERGLELVSERSEGDESLLTVPLLTVPVQAVLLTVPFR
jgi:hypothetical protein